METVTFPAGRNESVEVYPVGLRPTVNQVGIAAGLLALTFFFGALILAFAFSIQTQREWVRFQLPAVLWLSTGVISASSWLLEAARHSLRRGLVVIYRRRLAATLVFSIFFLLMQAVTARQLIQQGIAASANPRGSVFYVFMAVHAVHLAGGQVWLARLHRASQGLWNATENDLRRHRAVLQVAAIYWHFIGVLWLVMFWLLHAWTES